MAYPASSFCLLLLASAVLLAAATVPTLEIAPGVHMPSVNLGTCCGSTPKTNLAGWLAAGGRGIDTAYDYNDQPDIKAVLAAHPEYKREDLFITTKVPAGLTTNFSECSLDPNAALDRVKLNIAQLGVEYVDLVLLHGPCLLGKKHNNAQWKGLQMARDLNLTRAIGVSNYNHWMLANLEGAVPAVNQIRTSTGHHDDSTMSYCAQHNITVEAYFALKGCNRKSTTVTTIAAKYNISTIQVCLRWVYQKGAAMAVGTGSNASTAEAYAKEDMDLFHFTFTDAEMSSLG